MTHDVTHEEYREALREAKRTVTRGSSDYAKRVVYALFSRLDAAPPYRVNIDGEPDIQTSFCADCSGGEEPVEATFHWVPWDSLCAECSLARLDGRADDNPRIADEAERRASA